MTLSGEKHQAASTLVVDTIFSDVHDATLRQSVRQSRSIEDTLDTAPFSEMIEEMSESMKNAMVDNEAVATVLKQDASSVATTTPGHLVIFDGPAANADREKHAAMLQSLCSEDEMKLKVCEEKAKRVVGTYCFLAIEPARAKVGCKLNRGV